MAKKTSAGPARRNQVLHPDDPSPVAAPSVPESPAAPDEIQYRLHQAEEAIQSPHLAAGGVAAFSLEELDRVAAPNETAAMEMIRDVELDLRIEMGRTHMLLEDVLKLRKGSVVALDKLVGDPVDVYANGRLIARGEVLVMNDDFCVRVVELVSGEGG